MAEWSTPSMFRSGLVFGLPDKPENLAFDPMLLEEV
jgi:hypothetical protein